jgi:restriction system protein
MPIPEFNELKAPALQFFSDGAPHKLAEVFQVLAKHFKITQEEANELLPSGTQRRWHNRTNWACYDLFRAGLLDRPKKGLYVITELGKKISETRPVLLDREYLMRFPQFASFVKTPGEKILSEVASVSNSAEKVLDQRATPEEMIGGAFQIIYSTLKKDLLDLVKKMDPFRFEQLVIDLLVGMGYGGSREEAARVTKASNDEGIDGVINEDRLGLDVIYVQAKRWQQTVGRKEIQSFVGALAGQQAHKGVFITTSEFADTANAYVRNIAQKVILIDGDRLADLMIQHNIGVSLSRSFEVKRIDGDYFEDE